MDNTTTAHSTEELRHIPRQVASQLATRGKGILAADEGPGSMVSRFAAIGVPNTPENRQAWRQVILASPEPWEKYVSGVIFHRETFPQLAENGKSFVEMVKEKGVLVGITVDQGIVELPSTGEPVTQGLTDLEETCRAYFSKGARFAKWRATLQIAQGTETTPQKPTQLAIDENCRLLAHYAAICQRCGLCPIVEPEVLMEGNFDIAWCERVTRRVLSTQIKALHDHGVDLEGIVLKPSWVIHGTKSERKSSVQEVARCTLKVLKDTVPPSVPGIMFLSGGQTEEEAHAHLEAINRLAKEVGAPWLLSFSYGRAIQDGARKVWSGDVTKTDEARKSFLHRAASLSQTSLI
jgi:fructose-bisphosphate aldolase class I